MNLQVSLLQAARSALPLVLFLALPTAQGQGQPTPTHADVQARISREGSSGSPIVVHVVVALCDNRYQGIVPVPKGIGNGQDPETNLYWGAGYGLRTYFIRHAQWIPVTKDRHPRQGVLERLVLRKDIRREGRTRSVFLVAEAWDGREIRAATQRFLDLAAGRFEEKIALGQGGALPTLTAGGAAHLIAYVGHNGLMDFEHQGTPVAVPSAAPRSALALACASQAYFRDLLVRAGSHPLLLTTNFMAPEAYSLEAAITAWASGQTVMAVRDAAAAAYHRVQRCGIKGAKRLFAVEP